MSTDVGLATALRAPIQGRSRASYERMLAAAEALMIARGSDEFTLNEVSKEGQVSIGSIYNRFESKDALLYAVQLRVLQQIDETMAQRLQLARERARSLDELVVQLVNGFSDTLHQYADRLRPLMLRATTDHHVAATGKKSYAVTRQLFVDAMLTFSDDMQQPDQREAIEYVFRILYGAVARYLGFGAPTSVAEGDWPTLKLHLARMIAAFLRTRPTF